MFWMSSNDTLISNEVKKYVRDTLTHQLVLTIVSEANLKSQKDCLST